MKGLIVRTWPDERVIDHKPAVMTRPHVIDNLPRWEIHDADLATAKECHAAWAEYDGILVVEWDIAVTPCDLEFMLRRGLAEDRLLIAPYRWGPDTSGDPAGGWTWGFGTGDLLVRMVPGNVGDTHASWFGFGCTYIPSRLARAFLAEPRPLPIGYALFTDSNFCLWLAGREQAEVLWGVPVSHLHGSVGPVIEVRDAA